MCRALGPSGQARPSRSHPSPNRPLPPTRPPGSPSSPLAPAPGARLQRRRSQRGSWREQEEEEEAASPPLGARPEPPRQVPRAARGRGLPDSRTRRGGGQERAAPAVHPGPSRTPREGQGVVAPKLRGSHLGYQSPFGVLDFVRRRPIHKFSSWTLIIEKLQRPLLLGTQMCGEHRVP